MHLKKVCEKSAVLSWPQWVNLYAPSGYHANVLNIILDCSFLINTFFGKISFFKGTKCRKSTMLQAAPSHLTSHCWVIPWHLQEFMCQRCRIVAEMTEVICGKLLETKVFEIILKIYWSPVYILRTMYLFCFPLYTMDIFLRCVANVQRLVDFGSKKGLFLAMLLSRFTRLQYICRWCIHIPYTGTTQSLVNEISIGLEKCLEIPSHPQIPIIIITVWQYLSSQSYLPFP